MENKVPPIGNLIPAILFFFVLLFVFAKWGPAIPFSVNQITTNKSDLFTVSAEGTVFAKPDVAQVNLGFTANGSTVGQVQNQANQTINRISEDIKRLGIPESDIKTTNYNLRPDYNFNSGQQKVTGYVVSVNLLVKVRDFNKINNVIDTATADGANEVGGLNFTLDDAGKYQAEARRQAIEKAKQKANEIASQAGINLGRIVNVSENSNGPRPLPMMATEAKGLGGGVAPTQVEPGQSEISVTVSLSFETR